MPVLFATLLFFALISLALAQPQEDQCLICTNNKFNSNGVIKNDPSKNESGTVNGVGYHFYHSDGSGSFGNNDYNNSWHSSCKKDIFTDAVTCTLRKDNIYVFLFDDKNPIVSIGHNHYHNSTVSIRFGMDTPITTPAQHNGDFPPSISHDLISKFISNGEVKTRYMEWPYQRWIDSVTDTHGFQVAYLYAEWAVRQIIDQQRLQKQQIEENAAAKQKALAIQKIEEEKKAEAERKAVAEQKAKLERQAELEQKALAEMKVRAEENEREKQRAHAEQKLLAEQSAQAEQKAQSEQLAKIAQERARAEQVWVRAAQEGAINKEVAEYKAKIIAKIRRNIVMLPDIPHNALAEFNVTLLPGGMVLNAVLVKPSGSVAFDSAVERAIKKAEPLPLPPDVFLFNYFRELHLRFSPKE